MESGDLVTTDDKGTRTLNGWDIWIGQSTLPTGPRMAMGMTSPDGSESVIIPMDIETALQFAQNLTNTAILLSPVAGHA